MRHIKQIRDLPATQLSDEELVKVVRERFEAKAVLFVYIDQDDHAWSFYRWANDKQGGKRGRVVMNVILELLETAFVKCGYQKRLKEK